MDALRLAYERLMERARELIILDSAVSIIHWDMETMMPPAAVSLRSQQLSLMERVMHKMLTDPQLGSLLKEISSHPLYDTLDEVQKRNVHLMRKAYEEAVRLPEELVAETARQRAITIDVWKKAKASKDYKSFSPHLEKLFELRRRAAELLMEVKGVKTPYDALIDDFEPGMASETIAAIFSELRPRLTGLMEKCISMGQPDASILRRRVPIEAQRRVSEALASFIGYDIHSREAWGRIDETEHPFTTGYYDDVRITIHYYEDQFTNSIFSVLHEGGHALYERNLPREWMYQPVGSSCSYGIHESQSRFVENIVGRSIEFWSHFLPRLRELTGRALEDVDLESFVRAVNRVEPSKIRIRADEVTYGLHIIIRFELERGLFKGEVEVSELPSAWNERYEKYLGVVVEDDSEGVMQDTHWAGGSFGYFPSYSLGNIYSGQILQAMERDIPDWRGLISSGSFNEVREWLSTHVHRYGRLYDPADLIKIISGSDLTIEPFIKYLREKYSSLYGFRA
jgi:carboxypeptidase Taq